MSRNPDSGLQRLILDTARKLLFTEGYARLSMRKIAQRIGYSATSIYLHYGNKDELVHALIDEGVDLLHEELCAAYDGSQEPIEQLSEMFLAYINFGLTRPEYYEIMYVLHPEYMTRYPAEKYRKARRNLEMIASAISSGVKSGQFETHDPMLCANLAWTQLHGVVTLLNSERVDKRIPSETLIAASGSHIIRSLLKNQTQVEV
ncbi:MAG: TetR/AcrR family transcriptional regulator [Bacteroidetes bacterium]|nr:TetR/AcrR family transcriptional regulator [Bacteroidota bacterium]